jgi:UDP-N-acetylglucosamine:LPS N-acetylglucosamine transferase
VLEIAKTAWVIQDQELTAEKLRMKFSELFKDAQKLESMRRAYEQFQEQDATQLLAKEVCTLV